MVYNIENVIVYNMENVGCLSIFVNMPKLLVTSTLSRAVHCLGGKLWQAVRLYLIKRITISENITNVRSQLSNYTKPYSSAS